MSKLQSVHFVCGLGLAEGKPLAESELLAMRLAAKFHPSAAVFMHTSNTPRTCDNYKLVPGLRRVTYSRAEYSTVGEWQVTDSRHMSDVLRLHVLLSCRADNALYLDTDAYCTRSLDYLADIECCAMPRLGPFMLINSLIYAGVDRSFLQAWQSAIAAKNCAPKSYVDYSSRLPHELAQRVPGMTVLNCAMYNGFTGDEALAGAWSSRSSYSVAAKLAASSAVVHTMSPRPNRKQLPGSAYEFTLATLAKLYDKI